MSDTPSMPPGWYADPAMPGRVRWWSGTAWTDHVSDPPSPTPYVPSQAAPVQYVTAQTTPAQASQAVAKVDNSLGRISLYSAVLSLISLVVTFFLPPVVIALLVASLASLVFGIVALVRKRSGRTTNMWAPILGIILGALSVLLLFVFSAVVVAASRGLLDHSVQYPNNPEMAAMYETGLQIEHKLRIEVGDGDWPEELTANEDGDIIFNGTTLGVIAPGQTFNYDVVDNGRTFVFIIQGTVEGEDVQYNSRTENLVGECYKEDASCNRTPNN
jgi:Protein of unknown function (DUF2510)